MELRDRIRIDGIANFSRRHRCITPLPYRSADSSEADSPDVDVSGTCFRR